MKLFTGYLLAVMVAYTLGAVFVSQGNISAVTAMGFEVSLPQRFEAAFHAIGSMYDIYLALIAISLLIALPLAGVIIRRYPHMSLVGYALSGFFAMIAIHVILKAALGLSGIATTREIDGLFAQGVAGAFGGLVFYYVSIRPAN